jgi:hypothetical protein
MRWWVLLFLLLLLEHVNTTAQLVCTQRADAVAVVAAACQVVVDCRFELGSGAGSLPLPNWDVFLTTQTGLMSDNATTVNANDARRYFIPEYYITLPLLAYDNTSMDAVDCSIIAANPQTNLTDAVFMLLDTVSKYLRYVSDVAQCSDINELSIWSNDTGTPTVICQCAPGKICLQGNSLLDTLLGVIGILVIVVALGLTVYVVVTTALDLIRAARLERKIDRLFRKYGMQLNRDYNVSLRLAPLGKQRTPQQPGLGAKHAGAALLGSDLFFQGKVEGTTGSVEMETFL